MYLTRNIVSTREGFLSFDSGDGKIRMTHKEKINVSKNFDK